MGAVGISLKNVSTSVFVSCKKQGCKTGSYKSSRHHRGHEFMFVSSFVRMRYHEKMYRDFVNRYYEFRTEDTVRVCDRHHTEIHIIYDQIIQKHIRKTGKKLQYYTWRQAQELMDQLRKKCDEWLKTKTPGCLPSTKRRTRGGYQRAVDDLKKQWGKT